MARKGKPTDRLVYAGRRWDEGKHVLYDCWFFFHNGKEPDLSDPGYYPPKGGFPIGRIVLGDWSPEKSIRIGEFVETEDFVDDDLVEEWSMHDAAATRAKFIHGSRKRLLKEHKEKWQQAMEPLRYAYVNMSTSEKKAAEQLVLELLRRDL